MYQKNPIREFTINRRRLPHWQSPAAVYFVTARCIQRKTLSDDEKDVVANAVKHLDGKKYNLLGCVVMPDHLHLIIQPLEVDGASTGVGKASSGTGRASVSLAQNKKNIPLVKDRESFYNLSEIMHGIKSFSAHEINKKMGTRGSVFQPENFDRIIRDENEYYEKINYLANNPVKSGLVEHPHDYRWLFYANRDG